MSEDFSKAGNDGENKPPKKSLIWIMDVFASEFGNSDVQANYSRLYAWMANQLGHMTLGLATTLAFVWVYETMHDLIRQQGGLFASTGDFLLHFAGAVMLVGVSAVLVFARYKAVASEKTWKHRNRVYPLPAKTGLLIGAVIAVCNVLLFIRVLSLPVSPDATAQDMGISHGYALAAAAMTLMSGVMILAKDWRALALGAIFMFGAYWFVASELPVLKPWKDTVAIVLFVALGAVLAATARVYDDSDEKVGGAGALFNTALLLIVTVALFMALDWAATRLDDRQGGWDGLYQLEWRLAFAAAAAALTLWLVKEFGSDIPLVSVEVAKAAFRRSCHGHRDCPRVEREYFVDAVWDARTDGAFYVTGAVIGVSILTTTGTTLTDWASGPDFLGVLFFGLIFLWSGKRWAYRQQALDLVDAPYASRLAAFQNAVDLRVLDSRGGTDSSEAMTLGAVSTEPMKHLLAFAKDENADNVEFDHLVIMGKLGSGKSPLGIAISSEAALADIPAAIGLPGLGGSLKDRKGLGNGNEGRRDARYLSLKSLYRIARMPLDDIAMAKRAWMRSNPVGIEPDLTAADLLIVDDMSLAVVEDTNPATGDVSPHPDAEEERKKEEVARDGQDVRMLKQILPKLPKETKQRTVWMLDLDETPDYGASEAPEVPERLRAIVGTLADGLGTQARPARIALAVVRMNLAVTRCGAIGTGMEQCEDCPGKLAATP